MRVQLLSRPGCTLCSVTAGWLTAAGIVFEEINVDTIPELAAAYGDAIPVVQVDGREVARAPITAVRLRNTLARMGLPSAS